MLVFAEVNQDRSALPPPEGYRRPRPTRAAAVVTHPPVALPAASRRAAWRGARSGRRQPGSWGRRSRRSLSGAFDQSGRVDMGWLASVSAAGPSRARGQPRTARPAVDAQVASRLPLHRLGVLVGRRDTGGGLVCHASTISTPH